MGAKKAKKRRLDEELVAQGFFSHRDQALRAVLAGEVSGEGFRYDSPGQRVAPGCSLHVKGQKPFVSRGGLKLEAALDGFQVPVEGLAAMDVGCSTGGFTDCLLRHGAASVVSVDVGYAQFDWGLRNDPRVELLERTNVVDLTVEERRSSCDVVVSDVSFTSIKTILPAVEWVLKPGGLFITLIKPQFEAAPQEVGEGGVVGDGEVRRRVCEEVGALLASRGLAPEGFMGSPITGHKGNHEYLMVARQGGVAQPLDYSLCL